MSGPPMLSADLAGQCAVVVGSARTGLAVARALCASGARVRLCDRRTDAPIPGDLPADVEVVLGTEGTELLDGATLVVPSPGVPAAAPLLLSARARGIPIVSEVDLAARALEAPLVAITGTNGKSTTTSLVGEMLACSRRAVFVGGNLGTPLIDAVGGRFDVVVAEISSFQLEWVDRLHPRVAAFLNLSDDHLDRHGDLATYAQVKARLFARQTAADVAVLNREDPWVGEATRAILSRRHSFGSSSRAPLAAAGECHAELRGSLLVLVEPDAEHCIDLSRAPLTGRHNRENFMAAALVARHFGVSPADLQATIDGFTGLRHRMEAVGEVRGVTYIDDSKATNVGALLRALEAFADGRVVLVAGGLAKEGDYSVAREMLARKVRCIQIYGSARDLLAESWRGVAEIATHAAFHEAFDAAAHSAAPGDTVLLSPACASMDQFADYAARGEAFRSLVRRLGA